jgi:hypothetical protein
LLTWLEVAKVLLSQPRLFVNLDVVALKRRRFRLVVRREGPENALGRLTRPPVRRSEEADGVVLAQHGLEPAAGVLGLQPSLRSQADAVIGDELVDIAIAIAFGLAVADQNEQLGTSVRSKSCLGLVLRVASPWFRAAAVTAVGHSGSIRGLVRMLAAKQ